MKGIVAEFSGVPHRYCDNHFLRDVAKPVLNETFGGITQV